MLVVLILLGFDTFLPNAIRFITIFHGILAGVALGEYLKIRTNEKAGGQLFSDIVEELRTNQTLLSEKIPLRTAFWMLGVRSGRAAYLPEAHRRALWTIYPVIAHYNGDLMHQHRIRLAGGVITPEQERELSQLSEKVDTLIREFLNRHDVH